MEDFFCVVFYGVAYILECGDFLVCATHIKQYIMRVIFIIEIITQRQTDVGLQMTAVKNYGIMGTNSSGRLLFTLIRIT